METCDRNKGIPGSCWKWILISSATPASQPTPLAWPALPPLTPAGQPPSFWYIVVVLYSLNLPENPWPYSAATLWTVNFSLTFCVHPCIVSSPTLPFLPHALLLSFLFIQSFLFMFTFSSPSQDQLHSEDPTAIHAIAVTPHYFPI